MSILKETFIAASNPLILWVGIVLCIISVAGLVVLFLDHNYHYDWLTTSLGIVLAFVIPSTLLTGLFMIREYNPKSYTEIECVVEDKTTLQKIYNDYDIIDAKGDIYILRTR